MKVLKLENSDAKTNEVNAKLVLFPDNQPHINISGIYEGDEIKLICRIRSSVELMWLLEASNALDNLFAKKKELVIHYLMGGRSDRVMVPGDSVDLEVIADLINFCKFEKVSLLDVHSDVALRLIHRSVNQDNSFLINNIKDEDIVLICPDAGASKKIDKYIKRNPRIKQVVNCNKSRDLTNGKISLEVLKPEICKDKNCLIVDDICDGGATFIAIAQQIQPKKLTLAVTHGIFSKGLSALEEYFDNIITTDSYHNHGNTETLKTYQLI